MNEPIPAKDALKLISMGLEDCDKADAKQTGCAGRHRGPCGEGLHHHHDENCFPDVLARATMRPMLIHLRLLAQLSEEVGISHFGPEESAYPPLAALRDHYSAVRPDWRENK